MDIKKLILIGAAGFPAIGHVAFADDIGGGKPNSGADAMPVEEPETTESFTDSFFDELLDVFIIESDD